MRQKFGPPSYDSQGPQDKRPDEGSESIVIVTDLHIWRQRSRRTRICWRCGVPFADTTPEILARCAELARGAS